jgi:hypothetical protein
MTPLERDDTQMLRRIVLIAAIAGLLLVLCGCVAIQPKPNGTFSVSLVPPGSTGTTLTQSSSSSTGGSTGGSGSASTKQATPSGPRPPGVVQTSGPWKVNAETAEVVASLPDGTKAPHGKQFLIVDVTVQNVGSSAALIVRADQFKLINSHGVALKPFPTSLPAFNAQQLRPVEVATGGSTSFVYEIPSGATGYGFVVTPKQGASGSMSWIVP